MTMELQQILDNMRQARRNDFQQVVGVSDEQMNDQTDFTLETMMTGKRGEAPAGEGAGVGFIFLRYPDHLEEHAVQIEGFLRNRFQMEQSEAQLLLRAAQRTRGDLIAATVGLSDDDLDVEPVTPAGEWPLRQILAHVILGEFYYTHIAKQSLSLFRAGEPYTDPERPADLLTERPGATLADLIEELDSMRAETISLLENVTDEELRAPCRWAGIDIDLRFLILRYSMHDREHTAHLRKWRQQVGRPQTEAESLLGATWQLNGDFEGAFIGATDGILDQGTGDGEWTTRQVLAHITRAENYYTNLIDTAI